MTSKNKNLHSAKSAKNDEFYTLLEDIENELRHYKHHFQDKVVYCNADDPTQSNFFRYFALNFEHLGLKKLIASCYRSTDPHARTEEGSDKAVWLEYEGQHPGATLEEIVANTEVHEFEGDGDFRSDESIELLKQADMVVTNPPFSLFREYIAQLVEYKKEFLVLGNTNAITYKQIWPYIQEGRVWIGASTFNTGVYFEVPKEFEYGKTYKFQREINGVQVCRVSSICWFTNLDHARRHEEIPLFREYTPEDYPAYDNYDAIEVSRVANIPIDYDGVMGVPITFLGKHNPDQFEIVGCSYDYGRPSFWSSDVSMTSVVNGRHTYKRIFIRRKQQGQA